MSFIQHYFSQTSQDRSERDDILLAFGLTLVCLADGGLDEEEETLLATFGQTLPDWRLLSRSVEFSEAVEAELQTAMEAFQARTSADFEPFEFALDAVSKLEEIKSPTMRKRCFILAVDIAMAAGGITPTEDRILEEMAATLEIDHDTIEQVATLMAAKYMS